MANKRMFNNLVLDTDAFLNMPLSAQALYFHLNLRADDDGFISNPKRIQQYIGASEDDLRLLILKNFVIAFDDGVIVIKHWRMHNTIQKDRYHPTNYQEDLALLGIKENKAYTLDLNQVETICIQDVNRLETSCTQNVSSDIGLDLDIDLDIDKKKSISTKVDIPKEKIFSFDKHTNVENLEYYLSNNEQLSKIRPDLKQAMIDWMEYRDEKKPKSKYHYGETGLKKWVTQTLNAVRRCNVQPVIDQIDTAIANQWVGTNYDLVKDKES